MTKQEILELIEGTIVPNKQKGITASTLSNVLIEMLSASGSGSGSGDGALRIHYTPEVGISIPADEEFTEMGLDEESIQKVKEYFTVACAENAAAYQKIKENLAQFKGTFVILDSDLDTAIAEPMLKFFTEYFNVMYEPYGIQVDFTPLKPKAAAAIPAVVVAREVDYSSLDEISAGFAKDLVALPEGGAVLIYSIFDDVVSGDSNLDLMVYELHPDGSVTLLDTINARYEFTIPGNGALLESDLQSNKNWYDAGSDIIGKTFEILRRDDDVTRTVISTIVILSYTHISDRLAYLYLEGTTLKALQFDDQGNITITDYASMTPITQ